MFLTTNQIYDFIIEFYGEFYPRYFIMTRHPLGSRHGWGEREREKFDLLIHTLDYTLIFMINQKLPKKFFFHLIKFFE